MRILLIQDTDWVRRNPVQHNHLLERMVLRGHEIRVIDYEILWHEEGKRELFSRRQTFTVSRMLPNANHMVIRPGIVKVPLLDYASMLLTYRREINRQIREFRPDVVIGDGALTPNLAFRLARKNSIKTVYYCIDVDYRLIPFKFVQPLGKLLESQNMKMADLVISINEALRDYTIKMGASLERTAVIRAGVDFDKFNSGIEGRQVRAKYGFEERDRILLFVGWLYHFSGLKEVAVELCKDSDTNIKLLIVGDGDAFDDIKKMANARGAQSKITLAGRQPYASIPEFIAASDICLLPAYNNKVMRDIVPIKMYEYLAMGRPVIATKLPGVMREFGEDNGVVYVDRPEDSVAKAREIVQGGGMRELGTRARAFAERNTWDSVTDEFERALEEVIHDKQCGQLPKRV